MVNEMVAAIGDVLNPHGPAVQAAKSFAPSDYSIHFFLQLAVILLACRVVGWAGKRFLNQPQVVGEMIAGVVLGPSLLGLFFPDLQAAIFPKETRGVLYAGAPLGGGRGGGPGCVRARIAARAQRARRVRRTALCHRGVRRRARADHR